MHILVIEDEAVLALTLLTLLESEGYQATWVGSSAAAWPIITENTPDLIILDVMLNEGEDAGFALATKLRAQGNTVPILFVTARDAIEDRVQGLDIGGDDYLVKPYSMDELLARIRAIERREKNKKPTTIKIGPLEADLLKRRVTYEQTPINLTDREFELLRHFLLNPERLHTPGELLESIFPGAESGSRVIGVYIHYLRQKIHPSVIATSTGGYRLGLYP